MLVIFLDGLGVISIDFGAEWLKVALVKVLKQCSNTRHNLIFVTTCIHVVFTLMCFVFIARSFPMEIVLNK